MLTILIATKSPVSMFVPSWIWPKDPSPRVRPTRNLSPTTILPSGRLCLVNPVVTGLGGSYSDLVFRFLQVSASPFIKLFSLIREIEEVETLYSL